MYMSKTTLSAILMLILLSLTVYINENRSNSDFSKHKLKRNALILAFGDSLTYGFGISKNHSYPSQLQKKTGIKVINAGISGEVSSSGLKRLPELLKQKPSLVILCHGGNDILRKHSRKQLKENLLKMIELIQQSGALVLFVGVPEFHMLGFKTASLYNEVAKESDIIYENEVLSIIEKNPSLKSDYIHPNKEGYEMMSDAFIKILNDNRLLP